MIKIKREKGFTLIELLIVVAIILIIAAIAIPSLLRSRMAANQSSAAASLRTLNTANVSYYSNFGNGFPTTMAEIKGPSNAASCDAGGYIDATLGSGQKSGYNFAIVPGSVAVATKPANCTTAGVTDGYVWTANPVSTSTGAVAYCVDASGVIQFVNSAAGALAAATNSAAPSPLCTMTALGN
jgi:type IV pilus assembly protein PilA